MKLKSTLIILSLIAAPAFASDQTVSKTREQVLAELAQAQQNGEMLAAGDSGMTLKQINPGAYRSTTSTQASKSREQVREELGRLSVRVTSWWPVNSESNAMS
jgi:hypothetical protein